MGKRASVRLPLESRTKKSTIYITKIQIMHKSIRRVSKMIHIIEVNQKQKKQKKKEWALSSLCLCWGKRERWSIVTKSLSHHIAVHVHYISEKTRIQVSFARPRSGADTSHA